MKDWIQLQLKLYRSLKKEVLSAIGRVPKALKVYEETYRQDLKHLEACDFRLLRSSIKEADFVFIGDFHTLRQSQRFLLRLLRSKDIQKPDCIAFEVFGPEHLSLIKTWLQSPTSAHELKLREALKLEKRFGTHFESYKEILLKAHELKIEISALGSKSKNLHRRDRHAAESLSKLTKKKKLRTWIFFGEYHCARPHIPAALLKLQPHAKILVIQQNEDRATESVLRDLTLQKLVVLRAKPYIVHKKTPPIEMFCVLHTPLWIKYQSYLETHLEAHDEHDDEFEAFSAYDQIAWSLRTLSEFLADPRYPTKWSLKQLLDFSVLRADEPHFLRQISKLKTAQKTEVLLSLKHSSSALVLDSRQLFLSEFTINSCSQVAGLYLYQMWSGTRAQRRDFYKRTLIEAMGFFLSKLLNHSRKAPSWKQWQWRPHARIPRSEHESITAAKNFVVNHPKKFKGSDSLLAHAALVLGRNLSERAFEAFLAKEFSISRLNRILHTRIRTELEAFEVLVELQSLGRPF